MNYKLAFCDDNNADREYIRSLIAEWAGSTANTAEVTEFSSAESFLFGYRDKSDYDILLLDIEMGDIDGVSLAKRLRKENNNTLQIIFITGYSDYIAEGYEVAALHYLIKPINKYKLFSTLDRAAEKLKINEKVLYFEVGGEMVRCPVYQIRYAEVMGNYVTVNAEESITVRKTLGELEEQLDDRFFRVSRSFVVNLNYINRVTKTEIKLSDGTAIPLPRGAYEAVNRAIINMR